MASRTMGKEQVFGLARKRIDLVFFPDAANTPVVRAPSGVASVTYTAAGKYLITLSDAYYKCVGFHATYGSQADNVDMYAQPGVVSNEGTSTPLTAVVKLKTGANNTEPAAANADQRVSVSLLFEDSSGLLG